MFISRPRRKYDFAQRRRLDDCVQIVKFHHAADVRSPSIRAISILETVASRVNSPESKMFFRCLLIAGTQRK